MTKTNKTAIGTVGRGKQKLLIFEKNMLIYLFIYSFHLWLALGAY